MRDLDQKTRVKQDITRAIDLLIRVCTRRDNKIGIGQDKKMGIR